MNENNNSDEQEIMVKINETQKTAKGLSFKLTGFSHKHPYQGGSTKATAYLDVCDQTKQTVENENIMISIHGHTLNDKISYDTIKWKNYKIELKQFEYDEFIVIKLTN
jgi:hypothetical protein